MTLTEKDLRFLALCAPLEDAIELIDAGETAAAKALLRRILHSARKQCGYDSCDCEKGKPMC